MRRIEQINGFSLVELSVVLIILALLAGGVTAGQKLVKASKLKAVITESQSFRTAVQSFKNQYNDLPGDFDNAHAFWDDGANGVCGTAAQCNGDDDGRIEWSATASERESLRSWQHLSLSGFIEGKFVGVGASGMGCNEADVRPFSKLKGSVWHLEERNSFFAKNGNALALFSNATSGSCWAASISPKDAYSIDKKIDDGVAFTGEVMTADATNATQYTCSDKGWSSGADYVRSEKDPKCYMVFWIDFF